MKRTYTDTVLRVILQEGPIHPWGIAKLLDASVQRVIHHIKKLLAHDTIRIHSTQGDTYFYVANPIFNIIENLASTIQSTISEDYHDDAINLSNTSQIPNELHKNTKEIRKFVKKDIKSHLEFNIRMLVSLALRKILDKNNLIHD
jgi:predicted transcriptional regulator